MTISVKPKAIELTLSDGVTKVLVHEPRSGELAAFLRAVPALVAIGKLLQGTSKEDMLAGPPVEDEELENIYPLLAFMTQYDAGDGPQSLTVAEFKDLPVWDGIVMLKTFAAFVPKNQIPNPEPSTS